MYSKEFTLLYKNSGWELFPEIFAEYFLSYFKKKNIPIKTNLDLACGTGYLSNLLTEKGISSIGVDISDYMIDLAKSSYPNIEFIVADINSLRLNKTFDLVTCTCDSLNHLKSLTNLHNALNTAHKHLNDDGYFIFDIINTRKIKANQPMSFQTEEATITYNFSIQSNRYLNTDITIETIDGKKHTERITELIINKKDMNELLAELGFKIISCKKSIKNKEFGLTNKLFYVCKKISKKDKGESKNE